MEETINEIYIVKYFKSLVSSSITKSLLNLKSD